MQPQLKLDSNAIEAIRIINEKIAPYVAESSKYFVTCELNIDEDWNEYLFKLEKRGYRTLEEIWNVVKKEQNGKN